MLETVTTLNPHIELIWKVAGYPNYEVSSFGNVKSVKTDKPLKSGVRNGYQYVSLYRNGKKKHKYVHQLVANVFLTNPDSKNFVDHKDRDKANNHVSNLRFATKCENNRNKSLQRNNTSGVVGCGWHGKAGKWYAQIRVNNKQKHLGLFDSVDDATAARKRAERRYFGQFAPSTERIMSINNFLCVTFVSFN
jgi:hypothetical protein